MSCSQPSSPQSTAFTARDWAVIIAALGVVAIQWHGQSLEAQRSAVVQTVVKKQEESAKILSNVAVKQEVAAAKAVVVEDKAQDIKEDLSRSNDMKLSMLKQIADTGDSTHALVNSSMTAQLNISRIALQRVADLTKDPMDIEAARLATELYNKHKAVQDKQQ